MKPQEAGLSEPDAAVAAHAAGRHHAAHIVRSEHIGNAATADPRLPGYLAARALSNERLGKYDAAGADAQTALYLARPTSEDDAAASQLREQEVPSVRINAGTVFLRAAARQRQDGWLARAQKTHGFADTLFDLAYTGVQQQRTTWKPHQHHINSLHRMSLKESVNGNSAKAVKYALGAIAVAPLSETSVFVEHTSALGLKGQLIAKAKTGARGLVALTAAVAALPGLRSSARAGRLRDRLLLSHKLGA